ncbi:MAG: TRAP transporter small permease [Thermodesulfobacteriota bacterium]|nr:TRAP transporter small permease [Thermodesulfobacteriota bacterium]
MLRLEKQLDSLSSAFNWLAAGFIMAMMLLTCADVILRLFRYPIPGTYELVGLMGTVGVAFALAYTTAKKGHITVEFLTNRMPKKVQFIVAAAGEFFSALLFGMIAWQSALYALDLKNTSEVSLTVEVPVYPFVLSISIGCLLVCLILVVDCSKSFKRIKR